MERDRQTDTHTETDRQKDRQREREKYLSKDHLPLTKKSKEVSKRRLNELQMSNSKSLDLSNWLST